MEYLLSGRWGESGQIIKWNAYTYLFSVEMS